MMYRYYAMTLVELIIVLAIIGIISLSAVFFSSNLLQNNQAEKEINQLALAVNFARNEAVIRGEVVTLCKTADQVTCSGEWQDGQMVFVDNNKNRQWDAGELRLRLFPGLTSHGSLTWQAFGSTTALQFYPSGLTAAQNGTFIYCPTNNDPQVARGLIVAQSGRARRTIADSKTGVHIDSQGEALHC